MSGTASGGTPSGSVCGWLGKMGGYVAVAEELLENDYDGPSRLPSHVQRPTWWARFFGFF
ncbi:MULTISPECIES: hypothetical protein [unclassified Streptomyces]|uniref:hypothetical protein n=1 Tax=unclassified Streptomyces TaxID=2593676 RepID=UPI00364C4CDA